MNRRRNQPTVAIIVMGTRDAGSILTNDPAVQGPRVANADAPGGRNLPGDRQ